MTNKRGAIQNRSQKKISGDADLTSPSNVVTWLPQAIFTFNPQNQFNHPSGPQVIQIGSVTLNATSPKNIAYLSFRQLVNVGGTITWRIRHANQTNGEIIASISAGSSTQTPAGTKLNQAVGNVTYYFSCEIPFTNPQAPASLVAYPGLNGFGNLTDLDDTHTGSVKN